MEREIITGALFLLTLLSPTPTPPAQQTSQVKQEMSVHIVQENDTLGTIAEKYYGSNEFWTNLWNDNSWIENPDLIEKDWKLKILKDRPEVPVQLSTELSEKIKKQTIAISNIQPTIKARTENTQPQNVQSEPVEQKTPVAAPGDPLNSAQITFLGNCESGMKANTNTGNGYYGAFQFSYGTWRSMGTSYERADLAPIEVQIDAVQRLLQRSSIFTQFPGCAAKMRIAGLL